MNSPGAGDGGDGDADEAGDAGEGGYQRDYEHVLKAYGGGVRTALRNNATAYGFSISITAAYGLVSGKTPLSSPGETLSFACGAAVAFVAVGLLAVIATPSGRKKESGQVITISGVVDLLAVIIAVLVALACSRIDGYWAWPVTGAGAAGMYLLVGGLDVLVARVAARKTSFGSSQ